MSVDDLASAIADFERLPVAGAVLDLDGTVAAVNVAATRLAARPASQLVGRKAWEFAPGAEHIYPDLIASARVSDYHGEIAIATPQGPRSIHYVITLRQHAGRELVLLFAFEIRATDEQRAYMVESLGLVAGGIAHDFNNQLVSVLAESSSAREDSSCSPAVQDSLRRIEAAAQRMALLTRQLLSYAGRGRFVSELVDPDALVEEMRDQLQRSVRPDAELTVMLEAAGTAVHADRGLLREVVANLVVNASEALGPTGGRIRVATSVASHDPRRRWWRLEVRDEGIGMDARTVARIFDPFFTTKIDRHGLGLSAVHGIVRRLGGEIFVDSRPGGGSTFEIRVPVVSGVEIAASQPTNGKPPSTSLRGLSILVADDEPSVRATIRRLLERRGATVVLAVDGEDAAHGLRQGTFDLVLLDVMMPKLTGYQLVPIARQTQPAAKVMLMSGYTDATRGVGAEEEADAFLEKPFTAKQIDGAIDGLFGRR